MLVAKHAVSILCQVAGFARVAAGAEEQAAVLPKSPDDHRVRRAIRLGRGDPVVMRLLQSLLGPSPREQAFAAFGKTVTWSKWSAGLGLREWSCSFRRHEQSRLKS